jgi:hypothetical protein
MEATGNDDHQNVLATLTEVKPPTSNIYRIFKAILKPIWTYGLKLWCTISTSNIEILERFQSRILCTILDAP